MDLGPYQHCSQVPGVPMGFQYDGSQPMASQPNDQTHPVDSLPRVPLENEIFGAWPSSINNYNATSSMLSAQPSPGWANQVYTPSSFDDTRLVNDCSYYYHCPTGYSGQPQNDRFSQPSTFAGTPRTWQLTQDTGPPRRSTTSAPSLYDPSPYLGESNSDEAPDFSPLEPSMLYDNHDRSQDFSRLSESRSPKADIDTFGIIRPEFGNTAYPKLQLMDVSDDSGSSSREMTAVEMDDLGSVEPYAKLIHRALMSAPNHAMVLQEIYQWFRENTVKGSSDAKGWMNSIRHNLSMNAAFRKSERKVNGDETKKPTEWVLEDFAIKDGVQSTTRYRKGTGNKKALRSDNRTPARQTSGRKGGICSSKTKLQRQKFKEDRADRRSTPRADPPRQLQLHHNPRAVTQRQMSPLTPPNLENISSPFFFPKNEPLDLPYEDAYSLEDVQGVYVDDHGPLFSNGQQSPYYHKYGFGANHY